MSTFAANANKGLNLSGKLAVVSGGTQGIGAATALRFAEAGASVFIIGRDEARGAAVVEELRKAGGEGRRFKFLQADLSLVRNVKDLATTLKEAAGSHGIDYLIQTQGKPPNGKFALTSEGHEAHFAIQILSRFALSYLLAESGTLRDAVVLVCAPSGSTGKAPDVEDLELIRAQGEGRFGMVACARMEGNVLDAVTAEFNATYASRGLTAFHLSPGLVQTRAIPSAGLPLPLVLLHMLLMPLIARTIGNTPQSYMEIPVFVAANPKSRSLGLEFSDQRLRVVRPGWVAEEEEKRREVWERLVRMVEG